MNRVVRIGCTLITWLAALSSAQAADEFVITVPSGQLAVQRLAPGQSATLVLHARRRSSTGSGMAMLLDPTFSGASGYQITGSPAANCGAAQAVVDRYGRSMIGLPLTTPAGSDSFTCTYQLRRLPGSRDARIQVCEREFDIQCVAFDWNGLTIGDVPDFAIRVEPVGATPVGATSALVRVIATNPTPWPVLARQVGTECAEFGGGVFFPAPFEIENDFPGACATESQALVTGCINLGGQNYDARNYRVGTPPPGGEASCLLRLRLVRPLAGAVSLQLQSADRVAYADTGIAYDVDRGNDFVPLGVVPSFSAAVPALDRRWAALLALVMLALAAARIRPRPAA